MPPLTIRPNASGRIVALPPAPGPMTRGRRKERPALPPAPLTFAYPLRVPGSAVAGAQVLAELPGEHAGHVFMALRAVLAWAHGADAAGELFRGRRAEPWLDALVRDAHALVLRDPEPERMPLLPSLAVLLADMTVPERADPEEVSRHCLNLSEWALTQDATGTVLAFAEAAALASPWSGRLAWVAGKLYRSYGRMREAEYWLERANRIAVWTKDWEAQARSLNSLGNLCYTQGRFSEAKQRLHQALRVTRRTKLPDLRGEVLHDLCVVGFMTGEFRRGQNYAEAAFHLYAPEHPRLSALAYDVAYMWMTQGHFSRAIPVLEVLLNCFHEPERRFQVFAALARASGACKRRELFERIWTEAWTSADFSRARSTLAAALVDLGLGALCLADWEHAAEALGRAVEVAKLQDEVDVLVRAEQALDQVRTRRLPEFRRSPAVSAQEAAADTLADSMIAVLRCQAT